MKIGDLTELAVRNLREALLRNSLTTLGVAVGVASLVAMSSLGVGLQQLANKRLANSGLFDTVFVTSKANLQFRGFSRRQRGEASDGSQSDSSSSTSSSAPTASSGKSSSNTSSSSNTPSSNDSSDMISVNGQREFRRLDEAARQEIEHLPNVVEVYPQVRFPTEVRYNGNPYATMIAGVPDSARGGGAFDGMQGAFFSGPNADEAILQIEFAKELADQPSSLIGKDLLVRYAERQTMTAQSGSDPAGDPAGDPGIVVVPKEKTLRIVGIIDTEAAAGPGGMGSGRVLIPQKLGEALRATQGNDLQNILRGPGTKPGYSNLTVRTEKPSQVAAVEAAIKKMGFAAFSLLDATRSLRLFFAVFDLLLLIFGSLALVVAMLGIVNTLVMAILERRREIGILKALGAADRDVKQLFFIEAGVMGFFGGTLGVVLGWGIGRVITVISNIYLRRQELPPTNVFAVPWWLVLLAIGFAVLVSLGAGLYPAARAAKLNPVEALRYE